MAIETIKRPLCNQEGNFLVRANLAKPADDETPISDTKKRDPRLWVQAIKWF